MDDARDPDSRDTERIADPSPGDPSADTPGSSPSSLDRLLDSFVEARLRGERPSITSFIRRAPELSGRIRELFPAIDFLGEADLSTRDPGATGECEMLPPRLGEYRVVREIGRGGMGVVYEAVQESLGRSVALKVLPFHSLTDPVRIERFRREARAAAALQHPGIVPVYDLSETDGVHYYAMQYVDGQALDRVLPELRRLSGQWDGPGGDEHPAEEVSRFALSLVGDAIQVRSGATTPSGDPSPAPDDRGVPAVSQAPSGGQWSSTRYYRRVAQLGRSLAEALACAHERGILHRDIKPANLLVTRDGTLQITDFGLARDLGQEGLTQSGQLVGTLRYMAPERFEGVSDARADIYALGLTLYEMLTFVPAFEAEDSSHLMRKILDGDARPPRALAKDIPRDLQTIVLKAVFRDPGQRYSTAAELADDLGRFLEGRPILARPASLGYRVRLLVKRRWPFVLLTVVLLGVAGAWGYGRLQEWMDSQRAVGPIDLVVLEGDRDLDGDALPDLVTCNDDSANLAVRQGSGASRFYPLTIVPKSLASGDLDGDGDIDLALVGLSGAAGQELGDDPEGRLVIYQNDGATGFNAAHEVAIPERVFGITRLEATAERPPDLVIAGRRALWLLRNREDARFDAPLRVTTGGPPNRLASADLDGDGRADVVVSHLTARAVSIHRREEEGQLGAPRVLEVPGLPVGVDLADLNGDGRPEILTAQAGKKRLGDGGSLGVLHNLGGGRFSACEVFELEGLVQTVSHGDIDGDGRPEVILAGGAKNLVLFGTSGSPDRLQWLKSLQAGSDPAALRVLDWNRDGHLDVLILNHASSDLSVLLGDGRGSFAEELRIALSRFGE